MAAHSGGPHSDHQHCGDHDHSHDHHSVNTDNFRRVRLVLIITFIFMLVEAFGGWLTNSLALISDAGHMLTDIAALSLSLFAFWMSTRPPTKSKTYGYHRTEILAAFLNGIFLVILSMVIIWQAYHRYLSPEPVKALEMMGIAALGLLVNMSGAFILMRGEHGSLNMKGALFHVIGDALGSVGAILAGVCIYFFGWLQADPLMSALIAVIIVVSAYKLLWDTTHAILDGVPVHLDTREIQEHILKITHVSEVHDLHVWNISSGLVSLSVHVVAKPSKDCFHHDLLLSIKRMLKEKFQIDHVTIQIEDQDLRHLEPGI